VLYKRLSSIQIDRPDEGVMLEDGVQTLMPVRKER
jgi:hypothetical protein